MNESKIKKLDQAIVQASKKIKVLSILSWPAGEEEKFMSNWHKGNPTLPDYKPQAPDVSVSIAELDSIVSQCDQNHPVEKFLAETAESYADAGRMLMTIGTPDFTRYSTMIYGRPDMVYKHQGLCAVDAAKFFLQVTEDLLGNSHIQQTEADISSAEFAGWLKAEVDEFFAHDAVEVMLDKKMASKALAGATRIRIRESAVFTQLDKDQLLYHEAFIHTATQLNGRKQPNLKSLGLGAPRTTRTQEGIAVLAELFSNAMDINRLRRISLRVTAIKMALDGADFIEIFKYFLQEGQSEEESVRSAQRIFRSGDCKGGIVFTKDAVYLPGVLEVHTILRVAIRDNRPEIIRNLFAGRLTVADAIRLNPMFESGWLVPAVYLPTWATDLRRLAALLAYSAFVTNIKLDKVDMARAIELEEEIKATNYLIK